MREVIERTERLGIGFDEERARELLFKLKEEYEELRKGLSVNPFSEREIRKRFGVERSSLLKFLEDEEALLVLKVRRIKSRMDKLEELLRFSENGRIRARFIENASVTGRMSARNPAIMNVPEDLRHLFVAGEGKTFVIADFSQMELRVVSAIAFRLFGFSKMLEAFRRGEDVHAKTAKALGIPREEAKRVNFAFVYGASVPEGIFGEYPELKLLREKAKKVRLPAIVRTITGRKIPARTRTQVLNYPVQGSGADIFKRCAVLIDAFLKSRNAHIANFVHDEYVIECPEEEAESIAEKVKEIMERTGSEMLSSYAGTHVPVEAKTEVSRRWR